MPSYKGLRAGGEDASFRSHRRRKFHADYETEDEEEHHGKSQSAQNFDFYDARDVELEQPEEVSDMSR